MLPNGFDRTEQPADVSLGDGFWIVHTGRLYGREQQVAAFLEALAALPADVKALFVGVDESRVRPDADRLGLGDRVRVEPFVPLPVALGYQRAADALLLVNGRRPESMSSKVFEYLQAGRPVFAISPAGSAARALFAEVGGGTCVLPDDPMARAARRVRRRRARRRRRRSPTPPRSSATSSATSRPSWPASSTTWPRYPWVADPDDRDPSPEAGSSPQDWSLIPFESIEAQLSSEASRSPREPRW